MEILENLQQWTAEYEAGWLAHLKETGQTNFKIYNRPKNSSAPAGPGVNLSQTRLILVTSAGSYLSETQEPYNAADLLGDYSLRTYPSSTLLTDLAFAQDHYNHEAREADPEVLVPLRQLEDFVREGTVGELAPNVISFHGYMPDVRRFLEETVPPLVAAVQKERAHAALLVPA